MSNQIEEEGDIPFGIDCMYVDLLLSRGERPCYLCYGGKIDVVCNEVITSMFPGTNKVYVYYQRQLNVCDCWDILTTGEQQRFCGKNKYNTEVLRAWIEENIIGRNSNVNPN